MRAVAELVVLVSACGVLLTIAELADPIEPGLRHRHPFDRRSDLRWVAVWAPAAVAVGWVVSLLPHTAHGPAAHLPLAARIALGLVVHDLAAYGTHRALHTVPRLRRWHAVHHRSFELRWWTTFRFHPGDVALSSLVPLAVTAACGVGRDALAATAGIVFVVTMLSHADVWVPVALGSAVTTPLLHRRHRAHPTSETHFALVLPVIDRLFGTTADQKAASSTSPTASDATFVAPLSRSANHASTSQARASTQAS